MVWKELKTGWPNRIPFCEVVTRYQVPRKRFQHHWHFCERNWSVNSPHEGSVMWNYDIFSVVSSTNCRTNSRVAGDLIPSAVHCLLQLFSSMTASLMLNIVMSAIKGHPEDMSNPGLVSLGYIGVRKLFWTHPDFTESEMSSFWRNFHHWLHRKLSFQLPVCSSATLYYRS